MRTLVRSLSPAIALLPLVLQDLADARDDLIHLLAPAESSPPTSSTSVGVLEAEHGRRAVVEDGMVTIAAPGNPADTNGLGSVPVPFRLAVHEVTNTEYVEFLNAIAADDPNGVYDDLMTSSDRGGILRSGSAGSWSYSTKPDFGDKPAGSFSWYDAARYCNWLHHGGPSGAQGPSTTEDGAYDLSLPGSAIVREPGARAFIPTHDEWYKAAYYDPFHAGADAGGTPDYWFYPTRSDALPTEAEADATGDVTNPGANVANTCKGADWNGENGNVTTVGGTLATSAWSVFDLGGNVGEVTETPGNPIPGDPPLPTRRLRGGDFANTITLLGSPAFLAGSLNMEAEGANIGLRIGAPCPLWTADAPAGPARLLAGARDERGLPRELVVRNVSAQALAWLQISAVGRGSFASALRRSRILGAGPGGWSSHGPSGERTIATDLGPLASGTRLLVRAWIVAPSGGPPTATNALLVSVP